MVRNIKQTQSLIEREENIIRERNIKDSIDELIQNKQFETFANLFDTIKAYSHIPQVKKALNTKKKQISQKEINSYTCELCQKEMKQNYKHLHEKTKSHLNKVSQ